MNGQGKPIRPIETRYAGCRFRSRLEARWAVFLDTVGVSWEYEPEGFETSAGRYLPDFRVPVGHPDNPSGVRPEWWEIKPPGAPDDLRHCAFARGVSHLSVLVGPPDTDRRGQYGIVHAWGYPYTTPDRCWCADQRGRTGFRVTRGYLDLDSPDDWHDSALLTRALTAARSARFEHGENG